MKKDRLYKVNKGNRAGLARNLFWDGSQMSMLTDGNTAGPHGINMSLSGLPNNQSYEHAFGQLNSSLGSTNKTLPLDWYNSKPANVADYLNNQMPDPSKVDLTKLSIPKGVSGGSGLFGKVGDFMNKEGAAAAVGTASNMLGQVLSGGYKSGVGSAIGTVGNIVSALPLPGPWKALGPALNIAGGLVSGLTGEKVDGEKLAQNNAGTSYYNNFSSNAGSFDDVSGPSTQLAVQDAYSGGIFNKSAKKKNALARKNRAEAFEHAFGEVDNNVDNLVSEQINDLLAQSYAMGGDMDSRNIFALGGPENPPKTDIFKGFALYAPYPEQKGRTPEWDEDEAIFNEKDDVEYLKSNNLPFSRTPSGYYLDNNGKYYPGTVYAQNPEGAMSYYSISPTGIRYKTTSPNGSQSMGSYDMKNLSLDEYNNLKALGIDVNRFYANDDEAAQYIPNPDILFNDTYSIGNTKVTYEPSIRNANLAPNKANQEKYKQILHGSGTGSYHVVDPDKGYDFTIYSSLLRDGGSQDLKFSGTYPEGLESGRIYAAPLSSDQAAIDAANKRKEVTNNILSGYGLTFGNIQALGGPKKLKKPRHYYSTDYGDGIVTTTVETPDEKYEETIHGNDTVYGNYSDPMWLFKKHKASRRGNETPTPEYLDYQRKFREAKDGATKVGTIGWQLTKDFMNDVFGTHFALGGDMQTNGSDFTTGLSYIKEGGTHEENPYDGVQMGVDPEGNPNLVEEGERIYNDYVYSNRIYADGGTLDKFHLSKKKKITFSDLAGLLEKEAAERPNDPISRASLSIQLDRLADEQERQKQENERRSAEEAFAALSPEEQQAAMQEIAQQEQMAQQQAMEEQMAMQQQGVPEEAMSPEDAYQQEMLAQQMGGAPMMSAYGGKLYGYGGDLSESGNNLFLFGGKEKRKQLQAAAEAQKKRERNAADVKRRQSAYDREQRKAIERNRKATLEAERKRTKDIMKKRDEARINVENEAIYTSKYKNAVNFLKSTHPEIKAVEELASILAKDTASTTPQAAYNKFVNGNKRNNFRALTSIGVSEEEAFDIMGGNVSDSVKALKNWDDWTTSWGKSPSGLKTRTRAGENTVYLAADGYYYPSEQEAINVNRRLGKGVQRVASTSAPKQNTGTGATTSRTRGSSQQSAPAQDQFERFYNNMVGLTGGTSAGTSTVPTVDTPTYTGLTGNTGYVMPQGDVAMSPYIAQVDSPAVAAQPQTVAPQTGVQGTPQGTVQATPAPETPKSLKENIFNALGIYTEEGMNKWLSENGLKPVDDWDSVLENEPFMTAFRNDIGMDNPLYHALGMKYDFGQYVPSKGAGVTFPSITQGNWDNQTYEGWKDSKDPGWLEAVENWKKELGDNWATTVAGYNRDQIADALRKTKAFQRGTQWLQEDENNRLRYLTELYTNNETPEKAKRYAERFVTRDANGNIVWKQGAARDYNTIFNNPSGRAANPGTYWHTPIEALREKKINNYVWGDDGWELMATAVPENWKKINSYSWSGKEDNTDYTNNYYRNPAAVDENGKPIKGNGAANGEGEGEEEGYWEATPNYDKAANLRYLGLAGPALALGLQALGVGKPDPSGLDASLAMATNPAVLAKPHLIGDYMRYKPIDRLFYANQLQANSRATDRGIMNTSGGNRGTAMAGLLGNGLNAQTALANMDMQAENTNWGRYGQTKDFNRGTNIFNAQALNQNSMFNAEQLNRNKQFGAQMSANIAAQKMAADAGWNASKYKNLGEFFSGLSALGNEATQRNWLAELAADGVLGTLSPRTNTGKSQGLLTFEWKPGKKPGTSTSADEVNNKKRRV